MTAPRDTMGNTANATPDDTGKAGYIAATDYTIRPVPPPSRPLLIRDASAETSYLFGTSGSLDHPAWSDSTGGRATIRLFSRGIVGAAFFTLGGHYSNIKIRNYEPEVYGKLSWENFEKRGVLQTIAKVIDVGPGKLIRHLFNENAVRFHGNEPYHDVTLGEFEKTAANEALLKSPAYATGRSLGAEIVQVTFNFFSASIGDAMTRNVIQALDPHVKQPWIVDDKGHSTAMGHGHFRADKWAQSVTRASWRIFSKNAMEDWAAALPYVYHMKWQRQAIDNIGRGRKDPLLRGAGFKHAADGNLNGAMADVHAHDDPHGHFRAGDIASGFQWAGALDLHWRFVVYNWYTLMYRDWYDSVARNFKNWRKDGFAIHAPHLDNPITAAAHAVTHSLRYGTKSFIKANIYMQPAVIPFWLMRVPQSKWRGKFMTNISTDGHHEFVPIKTKNGESVGLYPRSKLIHDTQAWPPRAFVPVGTDAAGNEVLKEVFAYENGANTSPNFIKNIRDPYEFSIKRNPFDTVLNIFGALSYHTGSALTKAVDFITRDKNGNVNANGITLKILAGTHDLKNPLLGRERMLRNFVDVGYSYYPYMWLKAETALRVDDRKSNEPQGNMDRAIYNLMDDSFRIRFGDVCQDIKNIYYIIFNEDRNLISREGHHYLNVKEQEKQEQQQFAPPTTVQAWTIQHIKHPHHQPIAIRIENQSDAVSPPTTVQAGSIQRVVGAPPIQSVNDTTTALNNNDKKTWVNSLGNGSAVAASSAAPH